MLNWIKKKIYNRVYDYASNCQNIFCKYYLEKYLKKHIKFRTVNTLEYKELVDLNTVNKEKYDECKKLIEEKRGIIIQELIRINNELYKFSKMSYALDMYIEKEEINMNNTIVTYLKTRLDLLDHFNDEFDKVLNQTVDFSTNVRKGYVVSDITAKTKIQEHLISRLPIYVFCVTSLLIFKLIEIMLEQNYDYIVMKVTILIFVYFTSIYMIYLRVYQSVMADAKKSASDIYKKRKKTLYNYFVNKARNDESYEALKNILIKTIYKHKKEEDKFQILL